MSEPADRITFCISCKAEIAYEVHQCPHCFERNFPLERARAYLLEHVERARKRGCLLEWSPISDTGSPMSCKLREGLIMNPDDFEAIVRGRFCEAYDIPEEEQKYAYPFCRCCAHLVSEYADDSPHQRLAGRIGLPWPPPPGIPVEVYLGQPRIRDTPDGQNTETIFDPRDYMKPDGGG